MEILLEEAGLAGNVLEGLPLQDLPQFWTVCTRAAGYTSKKFSAVMAFASSRPQLHTPGLQLSLYQWQDLLTMCAESLVNAGLDPGLWSRSETACVDRFEAPSAAMPFTIKAARRREASLRTGSDLLTEFVRMAWRPELWHGQVVYASEDDDIPPRAEISAVLMVNVMFSDEVEHGHVISCTWSVKAIVVLSGCKLAFIHIDVRDDDYPYDDSGGEDESEDEAFDNYFASGSVFLGKSLSSLLEFGKLSLVKRRVSLNYGQPDGDPPEEVVYCLDGLQRLGARSDPEARLKKGHRLLDPALQVSIDHQIRERDERAKQLAMKLRDYWSEH